MANNYKFDTFGIISKLGLDIKNNPKDTIIYAIENIIGYFKSEGYNENEIERGEEIFRTYSNIQSVEAKQLSRLCEKDPGAFSVFIYMKVFRKNILNLIETNEVDVL